MATLELDNLEVFTLLGILKRVRDGAVMTTREDVTVRNVLNRLADIQEGSNG